MPPSKLKIGITLSGGGVRAAVFHLGVLARLADENLLEQVRMSSTVSGGSLVTGLVYQSNGHQWPGSAAFKNKSVPYVKKCLTQRNLQGHALLRMLLRPDVLLKHGRAGAIARSMERCWGISGRLNDIAPWPRWNINGTAIESGKNWRYIPQNRMGDYLLHYVDKPDIALSEVLCSSAAVPFLIGPHTIHTARHQWFKYAENQKDKIPVTPQFKKIHIWDGGAYDNLGLEALVKLDQGLTYREEINFLIVSDAAMGIGTEKRKWFNPMRLIDVTMDQVRALRARTLFSHFKSNPDTGVYVQIGDTVSRMRKDYGVSEQTEITGTGLSDERINQLKDYPTTLWKMKERHFDDLFQHGWESANAALVCQCPALFKNQPRYTS